MFETGTPWRHERPGLTLLRGEASSAGSGAARPPSASGSTRHDPNSVTPDALDGRCDNTAKILAVKSHEVLQADAAVEALQAAVPGLYPAAERAASRAQQALVTLPADLQDQGFADIFRAFMCDELLRVIYSPGARVEPGNRNSIVLVLNKQRSIVVHVLRAATRSGTPPMPGSRSRHTEFEQYLFILDADGQSDSPVSLVLTWDITAQGVTLFLTLPNPAASTRYCMGTHWCVPMPYPTINTTSTEASDYPDELDDYRPRLGRTSESDPDDEGDEPA